MAKVEFDKAFGIQSISGAISRKRLPDGSILVTFCTKKGRLYTRVYKRKTPLSDRERQIRTGFRIISREVIRRQQEGDTRPKAVIWNEVKNGLETAQTTPAV